MTHHERQAALDAAYRRPLEDHLACWRREADEQQVRFAAERAARNRNLADMEKERLSG
jgi:hypothetical protein